MSTVFDVPKALQEQQGEFLSELRKKNGKLRIGVNEVTKAIERDQAKLVVIAQDVNPKELTMHLPLLCKEKKIPYSFMGSKKELGEKSGLGVGTAAVAVVEPGDAQNELETLAKKLMELAK
ncbi:MAG: ribosomal L7Ae/L30e/S12e/Gadd45 family protein [Candidatus Diapherotrites archaeon]|nr:ribosomal L7Ae/L30e/S12e/Gadd45 family protein [Candidatus Diapherotrites archaeon]MDZ4256038.1 ribosomal L7Ae/L30e/S12e/Gadd45 family protein [archaeon]